MADDTLQQAISLVKAGKDSEARGLLYHLVKTDPRNEMAWLWLSETMNESQRKTALEQALKFNPDSQKIKHALDRLRAKEAQAAPKPAPAPKVESPPAPPPIPAPPVDRSTMKTAQLTFLPEDEPEAPPPKKAASSAQPVDRSQIRTAQLPPMPAQIDRSIMRAARFNISPDTLTPDKIPEGVQAPGKPALPSSLKRPDQTDIKTSQLAIAPDVPAGRPGQNPPPLKQTPAPSDKIDRSLLKAARFENAEPPKTGPLHVPPPPSAPGPVSTGSLKAPPPPLAAPGPVSTGSLKAPPLPSSQSPASTGSLKAAPQPATSVSQKPTSTAPLGASTVIASQVVTPPPPSAPSPAKPQARASDEPSTAVKNQMDALLTESHPSPDPVQKPKKASAPPPPVFPPSKLEADAPKKKPRRRLSGLEIFLIIIAVLLVLGIAAFLAWDFLVPKPPAPTPAEASPAATLATSTLPPTNTPQATPTPIPPPTLRPTFTPIVSPTATLNPYEPSVLFIDPVSCRVRQVSSGGGASQLLTESLPENCISPELSLDGAQYAYLSQKQGAETANSLFVASAAGSSVQTVIDQSQTPIWEVDWAPDNNWLAYTSVTGTLEDKPVIGLSIIRKDGTNPVRLTSDQTPSIIPDSKTAVSWSPDGQWIAFYADNRPYIVRPDGTGLKQLSGDAGLSQIAWSPDSEQIAFYSSDLDNPGILIIGIDGRRSFVENDDLKVPVSGDSLLWSPDGAQFAAYDVAQKALVLVSRNGAEIEPLAVVSGIPTRLSWSPDGRRLAYIELPQEGSPTGVLKVVNIDGTDLAILATSAANATLRWKLPASFEGTITPTPPVIKVPTTTPAP
jgi:Tol biopolymer transport system component